MVLAIVTGTWCVPPELHESIVAMLGASPGASTAVWIMLQAIERCFQQNLH